MSTKDNVIEAIRVIFPDYTGEIDDHTSAMDIEGWDSVAHLKLILVLEEIEGKSFDLSSIYEAQNVGDLVKLISN